MPARSRKREKKSLDRLTDEPREKIDRGVPTPTMAENCGLAASDMNG